MKIEAIRKNGHFVIPFLDKMNLSVDTVLLTLDDQVVNQTINTKTSTTYKKLEELNRQLEGDELIEAIMKGMPKDYVYTPSGKSDKELWYEDRKKKYE